MTGDGGNMTGMESAGGPTGFAGWTGVNSKGDTRDTVDTNGRATKARAELRHLRGIFSRTAGADSSLIFGECASRTNTTEGEGGIAITTTAGSHAVTDGSRSAGGGDRLPVC